MNVITLLIQILPVWLWLSSSNVDAAHLYYNFTVAYTQGAPDGVQVDILAVNGQFPGPEIKCDIGDTVHVMVTNRIIDRQQRTYPLSMHWHGLLMEDTVFADGPDYITQCPIQYGRSYEYVFTPNQSGTYWWHSHATWQYSEGLWGVLIVNNPDEPYKYHYNTELTIALNDWYHSSGRTNTDWYMSPQSGGRSPIPDTAMINGRGFYPCHIAAQKGLACRPQPPLTFEVRRNDRVRIRIINTSAVLTFQFSIEDHFRFYVIEVDGVDTVPVPVDTLLIAPAQRYSIIVIMNSRPGSFGEELFLIHANMANVFNPANANINSHPQALAQYSGQPAAILKYKSVWSNSAPPRTYSNNPYLSAGPMSVRSLARSAITLGQPRDQRTFPVGASPLEQLDFLMKNPDVLRPGQEPPSSGSPLKPNTGSKFNSTNADFIVQVATSPSMMSGLVPRARKRRFLGNSFRPWVILNEKDLQPYDGIPAPRFFDQEIHLSVDYVTDPRTRVTQLTFNGTPFHPSGTPILFRMLRNQPIPNDPSILRIRNQNVIQVVIHNPSPLPHPFHLHGHTFFVVGSGKIGQPVNWTPMGTRRDTVVVDELSVLYVRFVADNPGAWLFHCHINWHHQAGLSAVFVESEQEARAKYGGVPTSAAQLCQPAGSSVTNPAEPQPIDITIDVPWQDIINAFPFPIVTIPGGK